MIKDFYEIRFPEDIAFGATGGPEFSTSIVSNFSGYEIRNVNWQDARLRYNLSSSIKDEDQLEELISFFRIVKGRAIGFRFKDYTDYKAKRSLIGKGDGVTLAFQLKKQYGSIFRDITKPVEGKVKLYSDNNIVSSKLYNIDYIKGIVYFKEAPAKLAEIYADFEFDVPVRFDTDNLAATNLGHRSYSFENISLIEVRM